MSVRYYLSIFPLEALIASELEPEEFGADLVQASGPWSSEPHIFIELGDVPSEAFDAAYAEDRCASATRAANSVYLSIYRALEKIPLSSLGTLYLATRDGRSFSLEPEWLDREILSPAKAYYVYQELTPVRPAVLTTLSPLQFSRRMTTRGSKTHLRRIAFADLRTIDLAELELDDPERLEDLYPQDQGRYPMDRIFASSRPSRQSVDQRGTHRVGAFAYLPQDLVGIEVYVGDDQGLLRYPMGRSQAFGSHALGQPHPAKTA